MSALRLVVAISAESLDCRLESVIPDDDEVILLRCSISCALIVKIPCSISTSTPSLEEVLPEDDESSLPESELPEPDLDESSDEELPESSDEPESSEPGVSVTRVVYRSLVEYRSHEGFPNRNFLKNHLKIRPNPNHCHYCLPLP